MTAKELFKMKWNATDIPLWIVVAIKLPNGVVEIISNSYELEEKFSYYMQNYDEDLKMYVNPNIQIVGTMVI